MTYDTAKDSAAQPGSLAAYAYAAATARAAAANACLYDTEDVDARAAFKVAYAASRDAARVAYNAAKVAYARVVEDALNQVRGDR